MDVTRKPAKLERAKAEAKSAAMSALVGELDDSEELSGTQRAYDAARAGKRIAARAKARKSLGQEGGKSNGAAARSRVPGVGAKTGNAMSSRSRRRARPPRWRPGPTPESGLPQEPRNPRPQPPALPAPQRPRPQRGSSPECSCSSWRCSPSPDRERALRVLGRRGLEEARLEGLPPYITYEMVEAALGARRSTGTRRGAPSRRSSASRGRATMSQLATRDHNLFGMKWASSFARCPEVAGKANWATERGGRTRPARGITATSRCSKETRSASLQEPRVPAGIPIRATPSSGRRSPSALGQDGGGTEGCRLGDRLGLRRDALKAAMEPYGLRASTP